MVSVSILLRSLRKGQDVNDMPYSCFSWWKRNSMSSVFSKRSAESTLNSSTISTHSLEGTSTILTACFTWKWWEIPLTEHIDMHPTLAGHLKDLYPHEISCAISAVSLGRFLHPNSAYLQATWRVSFNFSSCRLWITPVINWHVGQILSGVSLKQHLEYAVCPFSHCPHTHTLKP